MSDINSNLERRLPKIDVEIIENEDGTCDLRFTWDETDPALQAWTDLPDEKRGEVMLEALTKGLNETGNKEIKLD